MTGVAKMGNIIIDVAEKRGEKRGIELAHEETGKKMLTDNCDVLDIIGTQVLMQSV